MVIQSEYGPLSGAETFNVGGVSVTGEQIVEAIVLLDTDNSTNVKVPLQRHGNPLWQADYHGVSDEYYQTHRPLPSGSKTNHVAHVKHAFLNHLRSLLDISSAVAPSTEIDQAIAAAEKEVQGADSAEPPPASDYEARVRTLRHVMGRRGQGKFRTGLLQAYSRRCAVTGYDWEDALDAAHLRPYKGPKSNVLSNGLLLRADIHTLLDLGLIAINPRSRRVVVSQRLARTRYEALNGKAIAEPAQQWHRPSDEVLADLWQEFATVEARLPNSS
jgi:hypothetical protein